MLLGQTLADCTKLQVSFASSLITDALKIHLDVLSTYKASLVFLCELYICGPTKSSLQRVFDVLWEAYLHTEEALSKAWSSWFLCSTPSAHQTSKSSARLQWFHTLRKAAHYTAWITFLENCQMYNIYVVRFSQQMRVIIAEYAKGQALEFIKRTQEVLPSNQKRLFWDVKDFFFYLKQKDKLICVRLAQWAVPHSLSSTKMLSIPPPSEVTERAGYLWNNSNSGCWGFKVVTCMDIKI